MPQERLLVSGDLNWEGSNVTATIHDQIDITAVICFPEEGEWLIKGVIEREDGTTYIDDQTTLTVGEYSGEFGWPEDLSNGGVWIPPDLENPMSITIVPSKAPLLGEPFTLTMNIRAIEELTQVEGHLEFFNMKGTNRDTVPLQDILIDGILSWQGSLKKNVPVEITGTVVFPEEGDWRIIERSDPGPGKGNIGSRHEVYLHIGKEESRYGWAESHEGTLGRPTTPMTPNHSEESRQSSPESPERGQITVSGNFLPSASKMDSNIGKM